VEEQFTNQSAGRQEKGGIQSFRGFSTQAGVHGCLQGGSGVKQPIYTLLRGWRLAREQAQQIGDRFSKDSE
jgi:hypothetical protein